MLPVIFAFGPFVLKTYSIFLMLGFIATSFIFWKRGREEHYSEDQLFDGYLLSVIAGAIAARLGYIFLNLESLGLSLINWLDIFQYPGINGTIGLIFSALYLFRYSKKNKWDSFEILDFWVTGVALGSFFVALGQFFDGSGLGLPTSLPIGMMFPSVIESHHPLQLYFAAFYLLLFWYLTWVEYHYRTFAWYKSGKNSAQTGFLVSASLIITAFVSLLFSFLRLPVFVIAGVALDQVFYGFFLLVGLVLIYVRSGRVLPGSREDRKRKVLKQKLES